MSKIYITIFFLVGTVILLVSSCGKSYMKSKQGESRSHWFGANCMGCHSPNQKAKDHFVVAGSVSNEARTDIQKKFIVKLYTRPQAKGKLVATLYGDELGNFYTNQPIDFSKGLFATLLGTPGVKEDTKHMRQRIFMGECNACHGFPAERLGID